MYTVQAARFVKNRVVNAEVHRFIYYNGILCVSRQTSHIVSITVTKEFHKTAVPLKISATLPVEDKIQMVVFVFFPAVT